MNAEHESGPGQGEALVGARLVDRLKAKMSGEVTGNVTGNVTRMMRRVLVTAGRVARGATDAAIRAFMQEKSGRGPDATSRDPSSERRR